MATLGPFIVPHNIYARVGLCALTALNITSGSSEASGSNLPYSRFAHASKGKKIGSKLGMFIAYAGGLAASVAGCALLLATRGNSGSATAGKALSGLTSLPVLGWVVRGAQALASRAVNAGRPMLVASMLLGHFVKREVEVAAVHKYSGGMDKSAAISICISYTITTCLCLWSTSSVPDSLYAKAAGSKEVLGLPLPVALGGLLYLVGQAGNFYHHWLLARLRSGSGNTPTATDGTTAEKQYFAPKGGLFSKVVCPHYLFELVAWYGVAVTGQHAQLWVTAAGMTCYLLGRSKATREWYESKKMEGFPGNRKLLVPGLL